MKVKSTVILTQSERAKFIECVSHLRSICTTMYCPSSITCETCPFDKLTDRAHDLADDIMETLNQCQIEGE